MKRYPIFFFLMLFHLEFLSLGYSNSSECQHFQSNRKNVKVTAFRNSSGNWETSFVADKHLVEDAQGMDLSISQEVLQCKDENIVRITGLLRDTNTKTTENLNFLKADRQVENEIQKTKECKCERKGSLRFHPILKGKNIVLANDGYTAYRIDPYKDAYFGGLFTNMPLNEEEMFEIQIERSINEWRNHPVIIGVIVTPYSNVATRSHVFETGGSGGSWELHYNEIRKDGNVIRRNFPVNSVNLTDGTHLGVIVKKNGDMHIFKNGIDTGIAATNVPSRVYGYFDLIHYGSQITIVN